MGVAPNGREAPAASAAPLQFVNFNGSWEDTLGNRC